MKPARLAALACCALLLSGCGLFRQKAAEFYLGKARKTAELRAPTESEVRAAFADIDRALGYSPSVPGAVALLGRLSEAASKGGFPGAQELEAAGLRRALAGGPLNWDAREALTGYFAARGDTGGLEAMAAQAQELAAAADPGVKYCAQLAALYARAAALPWLESEACLALNKSPETLFEKAAAYAAADGQARAAKTAAGRLAASDPSLKKAAPAALASAAEVAAADALGGPAGPSIAAFNAKVSADAGFKKAVELMVQGNASLLKKDYTQARAFYQGALNNYPGLTDARRQLAEADFQEGAALGAAGGDGKAAARLLSKAYGGISAVIAETAQAGNQVPFVRPQRFLGEAWSLKAASLAALRAVEGKKLKNAARLEAEFKAALDEALRLNPEGRLARELLERYTKEGF